ncbi:hypothetical protein ACOMHN_046469 [Nucella lapillus]
MHACVQLCTRERGEGVWEERGYACNGKYVKKREKLFIHSERTPVCACLSLPNQTFKTHCVQATSLKDVCTPLFQVLQATNLKFICSKFICRECMIFHTVYTITLFQISNILLLCVCVHPRMFVCACVCVCDLSYIHCVLYNTQVVKHHSAHIKVCACKHMCIYPGMYALFVPFIQIHILI